MPNRISAFEGGPLPLTPEEQKKYAAGWVPGRPITRGAILQLVKHDVVSRIDFQFNPEKHIEKLPVEWFYTKSPGQYLPMAQFKLFGRQEGEVKLFMYGREDAERDDVLSGPSRVEKQIAKIKLLASPTSKFSFDNPHFVSPGHARLILGKRVWPITIDGVEIEHQMFTRNLRTVMASATVRYTIVSHGLEGEIEFLDRIRSRADAFSQTQVKPLDDRKEG